ncbi:MAG TPA: hypothetical protein VMN78_09165 [Longimicrobiales bacterium]|nr:hypothetical protein [Longimicrobiales bacterium]
MIFFDGRGDPSLRGYLGRTLRESTSAAFAIRRIRLPRLDLLPEELRTVDRCRVLLGRLDADTLARIRAHHPLPPGPPPSSTWLLPAGSK